MFSGGFVESLSKDLRDAVDEEESAEDYGYLSDSDLEDDDDEKVPSSGHPDRSDIHPFDPFAAPGEEKVGCERHAERIEKGKVVKIPDVAFVTCVVVFFFSLFSSAFRFL